MQLMTLFKETPQVFIVIMFIFIIGLYPVEAQPLKGIQWHIVELSFQEKNHIKDPLRDLQLLLEIEDPNGKKQMVEGFWDGAGVWKVRFRPSIPGTWRFNTIVKSNKALQSTLADQQGTIKVHPYTGDNPLYTHGNLRIAADNRHFEHSDGEPFFWIGDTCWTGPLKAALDDWQTYLRTRRAQGFSLIQIMMTQTLAASGNAEGRYAYIGTDPIRLDPEFFRWLDRRLDMINQEGLVIGGTLLWSATWNKAARLCNPGVALAESELIRLARYMLARYHAHHAVWFLGGDADYRGENAKRWHRIGRAVFDRYPHALATMHPCGKVWVGEDFNEEDWFRFHGYQSGHWADAESARWIQQGPPAQGWKKGSPRPTINLEPCYEDHVRLDENIRWKDTGVRRRLYWSLLVSPTAGISYGGHGVWSWETYPALPVNHEHSLVTKPWHEAMYLPCAEQMKHLRTFFTSIPWWTLRPSPGLVVSSQESAEAFIAVSISSDAGLVAYTGIRQDIVLPRIITFSPIGIWWNPRKGNCSPAKPMRETDSLRYQPPGNGDWLLHLPPE